MPYTDSPACDPFFSQAPKRTMYRQLEGTRYHSRPTYCHPTTTGNTSRVPLSKHAIYSSRPRRSLLCLRATHQRKTTPAQTGTFPSTYLLPFLSSLTRLSSSCKRRTQRSYAQSSTSKNRHIRYILCLYKTENNTVPPSTKNGFSIERLSPL